MTTTRPSEPDRPGRPQPANGWRQPPEPAGDTPWWVRGDHGPPPAYGAQPARRPDSPVTSAFAVPDQRQQPQHPYAAREAPTIPPWAPPQVDRPGPQHHAWAEPPYRTGGRPGGPWTGASVTQAPSPPRTVVLSFWLWITAMVVGVAGGVVGAVHTARVERQIAEQLAVSSALPVPATVGPSVGLTIVVAVVMAVFGAAVALVLAAQARAGRPWARIVLTCLTALGLVFAVVSLTSSSSLAAVAGPTTTVLVVVQASIVVTAVVLLHLPASNAWFRRARHH